MTGQIGRYFYSFGLTSAAAIMLSMFVSFTLTPALCAMWMKKEDIKADHSSTKSHGFYAKMDAAYGRMLVWSLHHRAVMMAVAGAVVASAVVLYPYVGKELVPDDDQGEFNVNVRLPRGTSYQRTEEYAQPIEKEIIALPALRRVRCCGSIRAHESASRAALTSQARRPADLVVADAAAVRAAAVVAVAVRRT